MIKMAHTLATAALLMTVATPALAQDVRVRVNVDSKISREVTQELSEAAREAAIEVSQAVRSALGPELRRDFEGLGRNLAVALDGLGEIDWDIDHWDVESWGQSQRSRATQTDRETRRFSVGPAGQLDLETLSGDITIRPTSGNNIVVEIVRESRGTDDAAAKQGLARVVVESEERGGRVTVKTRYPNGRSEYSVNVNYIVEAPAGTRISTQSISGNVTVNGITGELSVNTTSGDVEITGATRLTSATAVSGDVTLRDVSAQGLLEASTVSGDVVLTGGKARRVVLSSISGGVAARGIDADEVTLKSTSDDVVFDGNLSARGSYTFSSHSGDVRISISGQTGFSLEADTFSGSVRTDFPIKVTTLASRRSRARTITGTFGDGSAVISATSFSGSVVVTKKSEHRRD